MLITRAVPYSRPYPSVTWRTASAQKKTPSDSRVSLSLAFAKSSMRSAFTDAPLVRRTVVRFASFSGSYSTPSTTFVTIVGPTPWLR